MVPAGTPARSATDGTEVPWNPRSTKRSSAAPRMASALSESCAVTPVECSFGLVVCQGGTVRGADESGRVAVRPEGAEHREAMVEENETVEIPPALPPPPAMVVAPPLEAEHG